MNPSIDRNGTTPSRTSGLLRVVCALVALAAIFGSIAPADAAKKTTKKSKTAARAAAAKQARITLGDLRRTKAEREKVRARARAASKKVNALKASRSKVSRQLEALNSTVRVTSVALDKAQRSAASASREAAQARVRERALTVKLATIRANSYQAALSAVATPTVMEVDSFLSSVSADEADRRSVIDSLGKRRTADVLDAMTATQEDLAIERAIAVKAEKRAQSYRVSVSDKLSRYRSARLKQQKFAVDVEARLEQQLSEASSIALVDSKLAAQYERDSNILARQLRAAGAGAGGRGSGSFTIPSFGDVGASGGGDTHGIRVAPSLRGDLARLLAAAKRDGIYFTGGGYRSSSGQVALRRAHCGSSTFAVYQARASSCSPPTARPGFSQHERGLAVDFAEGGRGLTRGSAGYRWLRANAGRYGLRNLPSEPWHWSTTGR